MTNLLLNLKDVNKSYGGQHVLKSIDLQLENQSFTAIMGRSGSGKSTLLNIIAGLEIADSGTYSFRDRRMESLTKFELASMRYNHIGYITQHTPILSNLSLWENVCFPIYLEKKEKKSDMFKQVQTLLIDLGLEHVKNKKVNQLSGGEIQRLGIARALLSSPDLIIADEPTGSLDDETALEILNILKRLNNNGSTVLIATHSNLVAENCEQIYRIEDGQFK